MRRARRRRDHGRRMRATQRRRLIGIAIFSVFAYLALAARAVQLQALDAEGLPARA